MKEEIWKNIRDYGDYYEVSNFGRVRSKNRTIEQECKGKKVNFTYKGSILKQQLINSGYYVVSLSKSSIQKKFLVHRLVAETFLDNPKNYSQINHVDENKLNNNLDNLEWCDAKYNILYNNRATKIGRKLGKKIFVYDKEHKLIRIFNSSKEASYFLCIPDRGIRKACTRNNHLYKNYIWNYEKLDK